MTTQGSLQQPSTGEVARVTMVCAGGKHSLGWVLLGPNKRLPATQGGSGCLGGIKGLKDPLELEPLQIFWHLLCQSESATLSGFSPKLVQCRALITYSSGPYLLTTRLPLVEGEAQEATGRHPHCIQPFCKPNGKAL